jgi:hypothetical protein
MTLLHQASCHRDAENFEKRPGCKEDAVVPCDKEEAGESTDEEQKLALYGTIQEFDSGIIQRFL